MKIVDAMTGRQLTRGDTIPGPDGEGYRFAGLTSEGLFSARALFYDAQNQPIDVPLTVRWTHPSFFLEKVGFVPT